MTDDTLFELAPDQETPDWESYEELAHYIVQKWRHDEGWRP